MSWTVTAVIGVLLAVIAGLIHAAVETMLDTRRIGGLYPRDYS